MKQISLWITLLGLGAALFFSSGCEKENPPAVMGTFELNFVPVVSGQSFESGVVYQNPEGRSFMLDKFKMYVSNITLVKEDGSEVLLSEIELFDVAEGGPAKTNHGEGAYKVFDQVDGGKYKGVKFDIGVPADLNAKGPGEYAVDHPLGINVGTGMYWTWATGYRFVLVEGKVDSSAAMTGASLDLGLAYHTGLNSLYRQMEFLAANHAFEITQDNELQFVCEIDINRLFYTSTDTIDMVTENITHSMPEGSVEYDIAERFTNNLVNTALYKKP